MSDPDDLDDDADDADVSSGGLPGPSGVPLSSAGRHRNAPRPRPQAPVVEAWARTWFDAVWPTVAHVPLSHGDARTMLRRMAGTLLGSAHAEHFEPHPGRQVGKDLVTCHFTGHETLGLTLRVMAAHLPYAGVSATRIGELQEAVATGYVTTRTNTLLTDQEDLREVWFQLLRRRNAAPAEQPTDTAHLSGPFSEAFRRARTGLCLLDPDGQIVHANDAFTALIAHDPADSGSPLLHERIDSRDAVAFTTTRKALLRGQTETAEVPVRCVHTDGHQSRVSLVVSVLPGTTTGTDPALMVEATDVSGEHALREIAAEHESRDPLTYLPNQTALRRQLAAAFTDGRPSIVVCGLSLSGLTHVNAAYGDKAGDAVLREAAERLHRVIGDTGLLGRLTGATFAVVLDQSLEPPDVARVVLGMRAALTEPVEVRGMELWMTSTTALVTTAPQDSDPDEVLRTVLHQLHATRREGRD